jgi:hypothetical protein
MKMKTKVFFTATLLALLSVTLTAQDQEKRGALEVNGGLSLSVNRPNDPVTNAGAGGEMLLHYRMTKHLGLYGGWGYNAFRNDYSPAGHNCDFEETGYIIGLQYKRKVEFSNTSVFVRAGYQYKHIELEDPAGELLFDTTHGPGWQVGCGIDMPMAQKWSLLAEVKFNALPEMEGHATEDLIPDRNYFSLRLGVLRKF